MISAESEGEKKIWKSVNICRSYGLLSRGSFLWNTVYTLLHSNIGIMRHMVVLLDATR